MNQHLQNILLIVQQDKSITEEQKLAVIKSLKDADKELEITAFKLDRTEKVKRTTAILLEETIEELEQKRKAVEAQNRELEVESSLERVRTVAMGMRKPDDMLEVCRIISGQLEFLNVKDIRNVQTAIFYESRGTYMNYEYYAKHDKTFITEVDFNNHQIQLEFAKKMMKGANEELFEQLKGKKLQDWLAYQETTNQFADQHLIKADSLNYYWYSLGPVALGISTYYPLTKEETVLFKRFLKVFELAYRRYLDIEKAEAQAYEAKIESSLERVRAQAMAMRTPEELTGICEVLFAELHTLGFAEIRNAMINIHDDEKETFVNYDYSDEIGKSVNHLTYNIHPLIEKQIKEIRNAEGFSESSYTGKDLEDMITFRKKIGEKDDPRIEQAEALYYYFYSIGTGSIGISTFNIIAGEKLDVLKRFRNVFTLAYQRYTDIAQAEAQAREAEIELALERVRARTMAMQRSDELVDVATVLFQQVKALGVPQWNCGFNIWNMGDSEFTYYPGSPDGIISPSPCKISLTEHPVFMRFNQSRKRGDELLIYEKKGEEQADHYRYMLSLPGVGDLLQSMLDAGFELPKFQIDHLANFAYGNLIFITYGHFPNMHDVFKRFAKVFEQTYTRFLDLQKAEAQAREAQIEASLERVRASAMAMHQSTELTQVLSVLFEQFDVLGICPVYSQLSLLDLNKNTFVFRCTGKLGKRVMAEQTVSIDSLDIVKQTVEKWKTSEPKSINELYFPKEVIPGLFELFKEIRLATPAEALPNLEDFPDGLYVTEGNCQFGYMGFAHSRKATAEEKDIVLKFATEFGRLYQRFLDLQKAEAQAREAQIELGLERVRARAMAMQHSNELSDLVDTVFKELTKLDFDINMCIINIIDESTLSNIVWGANPDTGKPPESYYMKFEDYPFHHAMLKGYRERAGKFIYVIEGAEKTIYDEYLFNETEFSKMPLEAQAASKALKKYVASFTFSNFGGLQTVASEDMSDEKLDILARFGKVFDLTYTRFNDLQKAEAQAREAQIELALERVRARTMAMQHSEELQDTSLILFEQLKELGEPAEQCTIGVIKESEGVVEISATLHGNNMQQTFRHKLDEPVVMTKMFKSWKDQQKTLVLEIKEEELQQYNQYRNELVGKETFPVKLLPGDQWIIHIAYFSKGILALSTNEPRPAESLQLLERFAIVFDQTYTRFLDLQKAEAQAREAKIETALERVRSRTMGMQKSEELKEVIKIVYQQLAHLKINLDHAGFVVDYKPGGDWHFWIADEQDIPAKITHPHFDAVWANQFNEAKENGADLFTTHLNFEEKNKFYNKLLSYVPGIPEASKDFYLNCPGLAASTALFENVSLYIENFSGTTYTAEENNTLMRFGKVFQQTYTRFLDLQKAEAQAREATIESALEKVRSRSLAMHHSTELEQVAGSLFDRLAELGLSFDGAFIFIFNKEKRNISLWIATNHLSAPVKIDLPYDKAVENNTIIKDLWKAIENGEHIINRSYSGELKNEYFRYVAKYNESKIPESVRKFQIEQESWTAHLVAEKNSMIGFDSWWGHHTKEEDFKILIRFAKVFEQAYTRFADLQKAEAQAREALIEVSLERVRSRAMAMHNSEELRESAILLYRELQSLGIGQFINCGYVLIDEINNMQHAWMTHADGTIREVHHMPLSGDSVMNIRYKNWKQKVPVFCQVVGGKLLKNHLNFVSGKTAAGDEFENVIPQLPDPTVFYCGNFSEGYLHILANGELNKESEAILSRFTNVFEITYRRFRDLQKAEAQTREAQINLAVERVRARALAMYKSEEILELVFKLKQEIMNLDIPNVVAATIHLKEDDGTYTMWDLTSMEATKGKLHQPMVVHYKLEALDPNLFIKKMWDNTAPYFLVVQDQEDFKRTIQFLRDHGRTTEANETEEFLKIAGTKYAYHPTIPLQNGRMCIDLLEPPSDEIELILNKMGAAFDLAYKRFEDLKNSEAQLREAQIEGALEKVRSRTMAMQQSYELGDVATVLFKELNQLVDNLWTCGFVLCEKDRSEDEWWLSTGDGFIPTFYLPNTGDVTHANIYAAWKNGETYHTEQLEGKALQQHYDWLMNIPVSNKIFEDMLAAGFTLPSWQKLHCAYFSYGYLVMITQVPCTEEQIFKRFAQVFDQTYTRFLDLQKAEAQTRQAKIETALEKVRARSLAMQVPEELVEVAEVLRHEMGVLGVEELETCSIYIHDETINRTECWYALKNMQSEEKKLVSDHFPLILQETWVGREMEKFYNSNEKQVSIVMQGDHRKEWINYCEEKSIPFRGYYGAVIPDRTYHLYKFSHGAIGAASAGDISTESWDLLKRAASVFSLAYSRFKDLTQARFDLQRLKEEKQRAETALSELQTTQKQLIQSEKMASLGELTAGIAHEIQNPLNFVNNFSEVSNELIDEMNAEIEKGDMEEAKAIANDIKQNLEKINHHGKRADAIVKGMLQHSSSGSGKKEPTNINALADEYLRLSYHGLRAKDKSFNATMKTDFDENIGNINIIPQDIGRVILNLITNAFYVVNEKSKQNIDGYEPTVTVSTSHSPLLGRGVGGEVRISVKDNGNGIPQKILDKIFQPFFTTKPTGQGTGLGLSLSYDIVKAHGGEIKVETKDGEGTTFKIVLPYSA